MTAQDGPKTPPQALQIVTQSSRETVVRGKVAYGSPQRSPEGAQEASTGPQGAPKKVSWGPQEALQGVSSAKKMRGRGRVRRTGRRRGRGICMMREGKGRKWKALSDRRRRKRQQGVIAFFNYVHISHSACMLNLKDQGAWREAPMQSCIYIYICLYIIYGHT